MEYSATNYSYDYGNYGNYSDALARPESFQEYFVRTTEYVWTKRLNTFLPPLFVLVGSIGNILAVVALTRKHMLHNSVCFYLAVLGVIDTIILYVGCGLDWLSFVSETTQVPNLADPVCRVWTFLFNTIMAMMSWLTVAALVDRFLVMWHPIKAQYICTVFLAKVMTVMILVALVSVCIHAMWTMQLAGYAGPDTATYFCVHRESTDFMIAIWPLIQATLTSYLPMVLAIVFTLLLFVGCVYPHDRGDSEHHQMRLTRAVVVVGLVYIMLELPTMVVNAMDTLLTRPLDFRTESRLYLTRAVCQLLRFCDSALLFVLLFSCVPMLRYEMWCVLQHFKSPSTASPGNRELRGIAPNAEQHLLAPGTSIEVPSEVTVL